MAVIHIIGAGVSGLAAALALRDSGHEIHLYESAPQAGGRCRSYRDAQLGVMLDNGNHLLLKANRAAQWFIREIGAEKRFQQLPAALPFYDLIHKEHWRFRPYQALPAMARLLMAGEKTVAELFPAESRLYQRVIAPMTIAAFNSMPEDVPARHLKTLLLQSALGAKPILPRTTWQEALIDPAIKLLENEGVIFHFQRRVREIARNQQCVTHLQVDEERIMLGNNDLVLCATSPAAAHGLLPDMVPEFTYESIINGHFLWPSHSIPALQGVTGGLTEWIFVKDGVISTTTSAANRFVAMDQAAIATQLWDEICAVNGIKVALPPHRIIIEKRATIRADAGNWHMRPDQLTPLSNLLLTGDYIRSPLPCTLELAIANGKKMATLVKKSPFII